MTLGAPTNADEARLRRLAAQIRGKKVVVKLHLRHTLHAKLYLLFRHDAVSPAIGFHFVMEWECLRILLRGRQPIIWVPARSIAGMRLKPELQPAFKDGRLLILSPFAPTPMNARVTAALAQQRNRFVGALADRIFVPHAAPGSRTFTLCGELHQAGKRIVTVQDPRNGSLDPLSPEYLEHALNSVTGENH